MICDSNSKRGPYCNPHVVSGSVPETVGARKRVRKVERERRVIFLLRRMLCTLTGVQAAGQSVSKFPVGTDVCGWCGGLLVLSVMDGGLTISKKHSSFSDLKSTVDEQDDIGECSHRVGKQKLE